MLDFFPNRTKVVYTRFLLSYYFKLVGIFVLTLISILSIMYAYETRYQISGKDLVADMSSFF